MKESTVGRNQPPGVRGPSGPFQEPSRRKPDPNRSPWRQNLERRSFAVLVVLQRLPRWLVVIAMALLLFFGLIQTGSLSWLGGIFLLIVAVFLGWLLALAWPVLGNTAKFVRVVVVAAVVGLAILKFGGNF
jgi:hypothetical protein